MRIYESNIQLDDCVLLMKSVVPRQDGDLEFSIQKDWVEISVRHIFKFSLSRRNAIKIPVIFYGKLSQSRAHTILSGSFDVASAWKVVCTIFSFGAMLSAGFLLGDIVIGQVLLTDSIKNELFSYYGLTLLCFLTIPLIKYAGRNDEKSVTLFLEKELKFRLKREIVQFSQSDLISLSTLFIAHILGFVFAMFF